MATIIAIIMTSLLLIILSLSLEVLKFDAVVVLKFKLRNIKI
jgi:hypothetical protein